MAYTENKELIENPCQQEFPQKIKCTNCEWKGNENNILVEENDTEENEYCPECKKSGSLMDTGRRNK